jgi:excinuclease ABC subunit A
VSRARDAARPRLDSGWVRVRGARVHNLKDVTVDLPRDSMVVFTGVSGSGKSSLAFGTLYNEAQRRYLESVSPYARRLFDQMPVPDVDAIDGLPPAVALQQQRGTPSTRSSVGSVTTLSNLVRMLYSRCGRYPKGQALLAADSFSPNTPAGACARCHGLGRIYDVTERSLVPDDSLTIRQRAIAAWPPAWHGQNLRDMLTSLGYDVDVPWRKLKKRDRDWILFTDEQPVVPVYVGYDRAAAGRAIRRKEEPSYRGNFSSARRFVLSTFASTTSAIVKKRVSRYLVSTDCPACGGKRLRREALSVTFAGLDIGELSRLPLKSLLALLADYERGSAAELALLEREHPERAIVVRRIAHDLSGRLGVLIELGLGYLTLDRSTPTLSPGELQRLRLATQVKSNLFGVVYVLDEPSAGLHPADTEALLAALGRLKHAGNSLFVVEHELDVIRQADWLVDVGPGAGEHGGHVLYSGPPAGLADVAASQTRRYLFDPPDVQRIPRQPRAQLRLRGVKRHNLAGVDVDLPLGVMTCVTGVSGSGKSSLVSQVLVDLLLELLGQSREHDESEGDALARVSDTSVGRIAGGAENIRRLVRVDQKPIGRTPRSNLATYTGLFDDVRKLFARTKSARTRRLTASHFSFNMPAGRCATCEGEGVVMVELLFLPSVYAPCSTCHGARYNERTLAVAYRGKNIAEVLNMTVDAAHTFFAEERSVARMLATLQHVGLGYLRLGQPATELSGGEAQRVKLASELQRSQRGDTLYVLDEPTTGLHPADVDLLMLHLGRLVDAGNSVVLVEHDISVIARSDWVIDMGPGAGDEGGKVVFSGVPRALMDCAQSRTAPYLRRGMHAIESDHAGVQSDRALDKRTQATRLRARGTRFA